MRRDPFSLCLGGHYKKAGDDGLQRDDVSVSYPLHLDDY